MGQCVSVPGQRGEISLGNFVCAIVAVRVRKQNRFESSHKVSTSFETPTVQHNNNNTDDNNNSWTFQPQGHSVQSKW